MSRDSMNDETTSQAVAHAACSHCGLPVPRAEIVLGAPRQFCCGGCRAVHGALHESGLAHYYELREAERDARSAGSGARSAETEAVAEVPARITGRGFEHLDAPEFHAAHVKRDATGLACAELRVDGLRCGACVWLLEAMPRIEPALAECRVDASRATVRLRWRSDDAPLSRIARRFDALGYQLLALGDPRAVARERAADRAWFARIGISGAIASNAMAVAFALYGGILEGMSDAFRLSFQWFSVALAVVAVAWPGRIFLTNAVAALRMRASHMDVPVAFGLVAAVGAGFVATLRGTGSIYCESAAMLVFLLLVGRFVQFRSQRRAREQVELLLAILPSVARRVEPAAHGRSERIVEVAADALVPGDIVEIPAEESAPADGRLLGASAHVDLSHLTGESVPVRLEPGAPIYAGSRPIGAPARIEVVVAGAETRAAKLLALVEDASARRAPVVELANRIAGKFLMVVLVAAAATLLWWIPRIGAEQALERTIALLVVTCPCALGLATPLAVVAGLGKGARRGVLVKGGDALERAAHPGTLVLDKTGTITEGAMRVVDSAGSEAAMAMAAAIESHSVHPIARAVVECVDADRIPDADDVREIPGRGIAGRVARRLVRVGSMRFIEENGIVVPDELRAAARGFAERALAPVVIAVDGRVDAVLGVGDPIRADAAETVRVLRGRGWRVMLASGDDPLVATSVARSVGIDGRDASGGLSPEEKLAFVQRGDLARPVVMVGDGINDLAALAAADVGVSVRNGAQASHHVADVCLAGQGMRPLARFLEGARSTMRAIRVNLGISVAYNALGGALAFAGLVNPLVAAILMPLSGLTVLVLALRMPRFELPDASTQTQGGR